MFTVLGIAAGFSTPFCMILNDIKSFFQTDRAAAGVGGHYQQKIDLDFAGLRSREYAIQPGMLRFICADEKTLNFRA